MGKVAGMDLKTLMLNLQASMVQYVLDKHYYMRKHGPYAYYGQENNLWDYTIAKLISLIWIGRLRSMKVCLGS
jgi:hypothetical protein